jgi:hypothetical protein
MQVIFSTPAVNALVMILIRVIRETYQTPEPSLIKHKFSLIFDDWFEGIWRGPEFMGGIFDGNYGLK